jgi:hypothetical protein
MNPLHVLLDAIERRRLRRIAKRRLETMLPRAGATTPTAGSLDGGVPSRLGSCTRFGTKAMLRFGLGAVVLGSAVSAWALGDVQVSVTNGKLAIVGDDSPNQIQMSADGDAGAFQVTGVDGTAINGAQSAAVTSVRTILIDMNAGQDSVELLQLDVEGKVRVELGSDRDTFLLDGGRFGGSVAVNGGGKGGDDLTVRGGARIGGRLMLVGGKKRDTIAVRNVEIGGGMEVRPGAGRDYILVEHTAVDGDTEIDASSGNDRLELVDVDFQDDVDVDLGDGDDDLRVEDCDFDGEIDGDGGDGDDELRLSGDNTFDLLEERRVQDFENFE